MPKIGYSQHNNGAVQIAFGSRNRPTGNFYERFFDGAARLTRRKNIIESMSSAMLRMLLAFTLRGMSPGLEKNLEFRRSRSWRIQE